MVIDKLENISNFLLMLSNNYSQKYVVILKFGLLLNIIILINSATHIINTYFMDLGHFPPNYRTFTTS